MLETNAAIIGSFAALFSSLVALWVATRQNTPRVRVFGYFDSELSAEEEEKRDERGCNLAPHFYINVLNIGTLPIAFTTVFDSAKVKPSVSKLHTTIHNLKKTKRVLLAGGGRGFETRSRNGTTAIRLDHR